jgi:hypothetical protein
MPKKPNTIPDDFWNRIEKTETCWLWRGGIMANGYGRLSVKRKTVKVHRLSWELHFGPIPDGLHVCHKCDVRHCVNPDHLFLGTAGDNVRDCWSKGRGSSMHVTHPELVARGEQNGLSKLITKDVIEIRRLYASGGVSQKTLGRQFGVDQGTVSAVVRRKTWKHI